MSENIIFEFMRAGNAIRASAFDPETMREVFLIVPSNTPQTYIKYLLQKKLVVSK